MANEEKTELVKNAFVAVLDGKVLANAVGSSKVEAAVNLDSIELSDEDATKVEIMPCTIIVNA